MPRCFASAEGKGCLGKAQPNQLCRRLLCFIISCSLTASYCGPAAVSRLNIAFRGLSIASLIGADASLPAIRFQGSRVAENTYQSGFLSVSILSSIEALRIERRINASIRQGLRIQRPATAHYQRVATTRARGYDRFFGGASLCLTFSCAAIGSVFIRKLELASSTALLRCFPVRQHLQALSRAVDNCKAALLLFSCHGFIRNPRPAIRRPGAAPDAIHLCLALLEYLAAV